MHTIFSETLSLHLFSLFLKGYLWTFFTHFLIFFDTPAHLKTKRSTAIQPPIHFRPVSRRKWDWRKEASCSDFFVRKFNLTKKNRENVRAKVKMDKARRTASTIKKNISYIFPVRKSENEKNILLPWFYRYFHCKRDQVKVEIYKKKKLSLNCPKPNFLSYLSIFLKIVLFFLKKTKIENLKQKKCSHIVTWQHKPDHHFG